MRIEIISLPSPDVKHILNSEKPSGIKLKYYWEFCSDYTAIFKINGKEVTITIPEGFESDGGTIPRIFGYFSDLAFRGYFIHDYIYTTHDYSRKEADLMLKSCLEYEGVSVIDRNVIYLAVRLFGSKHYKSKGE